VNALANRRRAATVLVALGPERAAQMLQGFDEQEVQALATEVAEVGHLDAPSVMRILHELAEEILLRRLAAEGGMNYAVDLLERVLGADRAAQLVERIDPANVRPFAYLASAAPDMAAAALAAEPPSSVGLALAHIDAKAAAKILRHLPYEQRTEVVLRIAAMEHANAEVVAEVDAEFRRRLMPLLDQPVMDLSGVDTLVKMLNEANKDTEREVLEAIEVTDPELASRVRDARFTFEDVGVLDDRAIQQVLKSIDSRDLALALKNADDTLRDRILKNLSERARESLLEEIEFLKGVKSSDINEARARIVRAVRALEETGTIVIERGGDDADD
jgi:flagellar motor switch protein FliG